MDQRNARIAAVEMNRLSERANVLVIAGTDSSGGAGLIRDVRVIAHFGAHACCAITAVTAQTHSHVNASSVLSPDLFHSQLRAALRSGPVHAVKIGMLGSGAIVRAVLEELPDRAKVPIVVDPVLSSSSGAALLDADGLAVLRDHLLPRSTLVMPNLIEAATLLDETIARTDAEQSQQAEALLDLGSEYVLLKGGHASASDAIDVFASRTGSPISLRAMRLNTTMRGTGCALSSAIAALLATGAPMESACRQAKAYVHKELLSEDSHPRRDV
jgi:hydroxymethylpyrimidine/phosphomethylpyrimidine kinase